MPRITVNDIRIRNDIRPGDLGYVIYRHGKLYDEEYGYGVSFETYVAAGMFEFYNQYDPAKDRAWICEHEEQIIGFISLMHRKNRTAQLRYFYLEPEYRGIGLGKRLMVLYMGFLSSAQYAASYLWTTAELPAAASLYTAHGFILTEEKISHAFGKEVTEQKYEFTRK